MSPISARSRRPAGVDVSMLSSSARFGGIEHRRLPAGDDVARPAYRAGRVDRHDLAGDEPIEQMADRGEPLLDARRGQLARRGLDPCSDMHRLDGGDRRHADARAPGQEFISGAGIGAARVRVADVGRKEFEEAHAGALAGGGDKRWHGSAISRRLLPSPRSASASSSSLAPSGEWKRHHAATMTG